MVPYFLRRAFKDIIPFWPLASFQRCQNWNSVKAYKVTHKRKISKKNQRVRLKLAKDHKNWNLKQWKKVIFSDESKIKGNPTPRFVRQVRGKNSVASTSVLSNRWDHSVMVWGCIYSNKVGNLQFIDENINGEGCREISEQNLVESFDDFSRVDLFFNKIGPEFMMSRWWRTSSKIIAWKWLNGPSQSPDLNSIEHIWAHIKRRLKTSHNSRQRLRSDVAKIWNEVEEEVLRSLYESMPNRWRAVIKAKGGQTKYWAMH